MVLHKTISTTPSQAIYQALDDLRQIAATPGYIIDMSSWHKIESGKCSVCMGGAVMAALLETRSQQDYRNLVPEDLRDLGLITSNQLEIIMAMDDIREAHPIDIIRGLRSMGVPDEIAAKVIGEASYTSYELNEKAFINDRAALAERLEQQGY